MPRLSTQIKKKKEKKRKERKKKEKESPHPPINLQNTPINKTTLLRKQKSHHISHLLRPPNPPQGNARPRTLKRLPTSHIRRISRRIRRPRRHSINPNAFGAQFQRERLRQADNGELGRAVDGKVRGALRAADGGYVDDGGGGTLLEEGDACSRCVVCTAQVGVY